MLFGCVCCVVVYCFFFFKQRTPSEIYRCAWGSEVCSPDPRRQGRPQVRPPQPGGDHRGGCRGRGLPGHEIGRAAGRERGEAIVESLGGGGSLKKKKTKQEDKIVHSDSDVCIQRQEHELQD